MPFNQVCQAVSVLKGTFDPHNIKSGDNSLVATVVAGAHEGNDSQPANTTASPLKCIAKVQVKVRSGFSSQNVFCGYVPGHCQQLAHCVCAP